ncbi:MAG: DUF3426 domain-containing protein [Gammaproteobacteria bacterium]|nr:MAG: DUF3426 domain-containing protein [Gammaproteobacteria bacterium]
MFTRCPECETIFRLGAQDLRRAAGKVRCGECASVFNALEYLEEEAEQLSPAIHSWPTEPANDEDCGQPEDSAASDSDEGAPDTLYEDNNEDQSDRQANHPVEGSGSDTGIDSDADLSNDTGAGILVIDPADDDQADAETNPIIENGNEFTFDSAVEDGPSYDESAPESDSDIASAAENKYGSTYAEPDNDDGSDPADDEIVSFITPNESTTVDPEVSKSIATGRQSSGSNTDDQDETRAYDVASWSGGLGEEIDISAADATVEFTISDDQYDTEEAIITIITDETDNDIDDDIDNDQQYAETTNEDPDETEDDNIDEFDNTIWERIPGVGSIETGSNYPLVGGPAEHSNLHPDEPGIDATVPQLHPLSPDTPTGAQPTAESNTDTLEFNAPADTWGNIFSRTSRTGNKVDIAVDTQSGTARTADEDHDPSECPPEPRYDDNTGLSPADLGNDDPMDRATEPDEGRDTESASQDEPVNEAINDASTKDTGAALHAEIRSDTPAEQHEPAAAQALEKNAASEQFSGEFYAEEEYDVQHIILTDESEPDSTGLTQAFAAAAAANAADEENPSWQPESLKDVPEQKTRALLWLMGGLVMAATLVLQLVHYNRDALAGSPAWGDSVRTIYNGFGMELFPNWSLDDYEIRGSEAIAGESGPDIMDIRAQIASVGEKPTGLPHIRVVLRDRWSNPVAAKTFSPLEYAQPDNLPLNRLMRPNETLAAHVSIIDPGSGAQGFELELCLPRRYTGLECTGRPFD